MMPTTITGIAVVEAILVRPLQTAIPGNSMIIGVHVRLRDHTVITTGEAAQIVEEEDTGEVSNMIANVITNMGEGKIWGAARTMQIGTARLQWTDMREVEHDLIQVQMKLPQRSDVETMTAPEEEEAILARDLTKEFPGI